MRGNTKLARPARSQDRASSLGEKGQAGGGKREAKAEWVTVLLPVADFCGVCGVRLGPGNRDGSGRCVQCGIEERIAASPDRQNQRRNLGRRRRVTEKEHERIVKLARQGLFDTAISKRVGYGPTVVNRHARVVRAGRPKRRRLRH